LANSLPILLLKTLISEVLVKCAFTRSLIPQITYAPEKDDVTPIIVITVVIIVTSELPRASSITRDASVMILKHQPKISIVSTFFIQHQLSTIR
jgi:hypothetical protein